MLLWTIGASLFGKMFAWKGIVRAGYGSKKKKKKKNFWFLLIF